MTDEQKAAQVRADLQPHLDAIAAIMTEAHKSNGLVVNFQLNTDGNTQATTVSPIMITKPVKL